MVGWIKKGKKWMDGGWIEEMIKQMDGWMDRKKWMIGWIKNRWTDRKEKKKKMDGWMDKKYMKKWMVGWIKKGMDGWMDGYKKK